VAADGGSGLELGLELTARRRQEQAAKTAAPAVPLEVRLDVFHTRREGERASRCDWRQAEGHWQEAEKVERAKARVRRRGTDLRCFNGRLEKAWAAAVAAFDEADRKEKAWARAVAALAVFRPDGRLNDRAWAAAEVAAAAAALTGPRWAKARRMLLDRRSLTFLDRLHEDLAVAAPRREVREALVALWRCRRQEGRRGAGAEPPAWGAIEAALVGALSRELGEGWEGAYRQVGRLLRRVVRASSAVECVNSVVRMHQARHRNLGQELLDLKRLYWNCRRFGAGKRRRRCPYEHLGLRLPSYDAWELLQLNPEELAQQVSTQELAA
jgi:hypothetical protein